MEHHRFSDTQTKTLAQKFGVHDIRYGIAARCPLARGESTTAIFYDLQPKELVEMLTVYIDNERFLHADCATFAVLVDMINHPGASGLAFPLFSSGSSLSTKRREEIRQLKDLVGPYQGKSLHDWYHCVISVTRPDPVPAGHHKHQWVARYGSEKNQFIGITHDHGIVVGPLSFWILRQGGDALVSGVW